MNHKVQLALGTAILALLVVGTVSHRALARSSESDRWVEHTHQVLENLQDLRFAMASVESSWRGFALTGGESYSEQYQASRLRVQQDQASVRRLTVDNPEQQSRLSALETLAAGQLERADAVMGLRRTQGLEAAAEELRNQAGPAMGDEFQAGARLMQDEEMQLLAARGADAERRLSQARGILLLGTVLGLVITAGAGWVLRSGAAAGALVEAARRGEESADHEVEAHLAQMENRYRGLLEAAPDAMVVVNQGGEIVLLNVQAEKQFGYRRDELVGQKVKNIIPQGFAERLIADGTRSAAEALAQQIGTGIELSARRKDGSEFPIEIMLSPLESAEGILVTAAIRDISVRKNAETHLAQMEGRYRGLLEAAPDAMVVVNQSGDIVLLNVQAEKQFGYRRDELVGQKVKNIIPQGFAERLIADGTRTAAEALAQQIGTGIELSGRRKDGSEFPIEIMLSPLESAEGTLVTAAIRDISVRKAADKHLAQMEGRYRGLLEAAPDAMVVVKPGGEIVLLNVQAEKQFGYRRDELLGKKVKSIIPEGFAERLIADGTRTPAEALAQQIGTGLELLGRRKDGTEFPIEIMLSPLESAEGILVTAAIRDISVRKTADEHLAQMEGRYRGLLEAAPDAMVVVNQAGEIVLLNVQAEKQFGYRRDELVGQEVKNIIPEGFAERLIADALRSPEDALAQQIGTGIELIARHKNGSDFPIELMLSPLESAEGILVTAAIRDISTRKKAELHLLRKMEELNRSNEELGQFAYIASHDLQEPLRMVASYTQLLSRRYKGKLDKDADEFIAFAVDGASRMQRLIQDLLAYSRVGTKGKDLVDTSSEEALRRALINLRGAIEESGALVTHDPLPEVLADETQLIQLFQNLVGNAIKYQGPGIPQVHISAVPQGEKEWVFSVRDNGLGIDSQYFEKIFGMFQRLHKREEFAGTGIGLAICKKIVERHGGSISVESQPGQGSTFRFALGRSETKAMTATGGSHAR
ncbi:MAG TPA: PAS domain S-box protein [Terriglobales bacterium]|nr:PAS domain S-box protein [Terriglobales bacterium]